MGTVNGIKGESGVRQRGSGSLNKACPFRSPSRQFQTSLKLREDEGLGSVTLDLPPRHEPHVLWCQPCAYSHPFPVVLGTPTHDLSSVVSRCLCFHLPLNLVLQKKGLSSAELDYGTLTQMGRSPLFLRRSCLRRLKTVQRETQGGSKRSLKGSSSDIPYSLYFILLCIFGSPIIVGEDTKQGYSFPYIDIRVVTRRQMLTENYV